MALSACVPAMLYCALRAPHLTPRAQALTFSMSAVASMLPLEKGVAWTLWPTLNTIARQATTPANIPTTVWGLLTSLITLWLSYQWLKEVLAGWKYEPFAYFYTQHKFSWV